MKLAILSGGRSTERKVSLRSAGEIIKNLKTDKYDIRNFEIPAENDNSWIKDLTAWQPDLVFSALHGGIGENGAIQGLLDTLQIPYTGSGILASAIGMKKDISKVIMAAAGVPLADGVLLRRGDNIPETMSVPLVVKPNNGGSSVGVTIVRKMVDLAPAIEAALAVDSEVLVEQFIEGRELTVGLVETNGELMALDVIEIIPRAGDFFDYESKYSDGGADEVVADLPESIKQHAQDIAKTVFRALGCANYGRVDMILSGDDLYVLEMNTLPGMTSASLIPKAAASRWNYSDFLDILIESALRR